MTVSKVCYSMMDGNLNLSMSFSDKPESKIMWLNYLLFHISRNQKSYG